MRRLVALTALIWLLLAPPASAQPAIDPGCFSGGLVICAGASGAVPPTFPYPANLSVTTHSPNEVVLLFIESQSATASSPITFSISSECGTWINRSHQAGSLTQLPNNALTVDLWFLPVPSPLSDCNAVATPSGNTYGFGYVMFGLSGVASISNPFDPNGSLPSQTGNLSSATATMTGTVSTSNAKDLLLAWGASTLVDPLSTNCVFPTDTNLWKAIGFVGGGAPPQPAASGSLPPQGLFTQMTGGPWFCSSLIVQVLAVTSPQSATTLGTNFTSPRWSFYATDAVTSGGATPGQLFRSLPQ